MSGWFRLHRGWRDCEAFDQGVAFSEREAWLWLIEHAAFKPMARRNAKGERVQIGRGQLHTSLRSLGEAWTWGKNKVARFIEKLGDHEMVGTVAGQSGIVITICNYDKYQDIEDSRDTETGTVAGQSRDTQEEGKEGKEDKPSRKRENRKPDFVIPDWIPAEPWAAYAAMRVRKKAPLDDYIAAKQFEKLAALASDGWDVAKVLDKATVNNWTDIFAPTPGRDDNLRAASPAKQSPAAERTPEQEEKYRAYLRGDIQLGDYMAGAPPISPQPPPRRANGGSSAKPIGQLIPQIGHPA